MKKLPFATLAVLAACASSQAAPPQSVLFDFDNAHQYTSLPQDITVGNLTAHLAATGQGFSIQSANTMGFTPAGFSGLCIYPNSVYGADLLISFSQTITDFSILFSPQELGCDDTARMRVTASMNSTLVGTSTAFAPFPGTWPPGTLTFAAPQGFNSVVVHYDARPPTCQDYGVIFLADNMIVTPKACPADFNVDGTANVADIFAFLRAWFGKDPSADINGSGTVEVADIFAFLRAWFAKC